MDRKEYPSDKADRFIIRMPTGLRQKVKEEACKDGGRSMNSLIVEFIQAGMARLEKTKAPDVRASRAFKTPIER